MKRIAMLVLIAMVLSAGCAKDDGPTAPTTGTISGQVSDMYSGQAIVGATVITQPVTRTATTDEQGRYTLSDVPVASYTVVASKEGYSRSSIQTEVVREEIATVHIGLQIAQVHPAGEERMLPLGAAGDSIRMCWVPAGNFLMGSTDNEQDRESNEGPAHLVTISEGFWIGKYEVTQAQWQAVMGNNPASEIGTGTNFPVYNVSWNDIQQFEESLGGAFRLPSEAEWEYAYRAGTTTRYYWGNDSSYSEIGNYAWHYSNSGQLTHPVGGKVPNTWGLCDMSGNVWEWSEDRTTIDYNGAPTDGSAWVGGGEEFRSARGGAWDFHEPQFCRASVRSWQRPDSRYTAYGFRVIATTRL